MKKSLKVMALFLALSLVACNSGNNEPKPSEGSTPAAESSGTHEHTYNMDVWESDETHHWHPATCEHTSSKKDNAPHEWVIDESQTQGAATCTQMGNLYEKCKVCGMTRVTTDVLAEHVWQNVTSDHEKGADEVTTTIRKCQNCHREEISWNAQDSAKVFEQNNSKNEGEFNSDGKLTKNGNKVTYKVYVPEAKTMRLWAKITYQSTEHATKDNREYRQGLWYNYKEEDGVDGTGFKFQVYLGETKIDQAAQTFNVGGTDVDIKKLVFEDFGDNDTGPSLCAWVELNLAQGLNSISIMRNTGYANSFQSFTLIG